MFEERLMHIVLVGDSVFDNASLAIATLAITRGVRDVISQVPDLLPEGWRASVLAVNRATSKEVPAHLQRIPPDASHLVRRQ